MPPPRGALHLRIRHGHHLVGDAVHLLFVFVIRLADGELGLCAGGTEYAANLRPLRQLY
jgi:hypothetical protein